MPDITIPDAEIEAGAKALLEHEVGDMLTWEKLLESFKRSYRNQAFIVLAAAALVREQDNG